MREFCYAALHKIPTVQTLEGNKMIRAIVAIIVLFILPYSAVAEVDNAEFIRKAKLLNVNSLDESLPNIEFEKWLLNISNNSSPIKWETNDCGEQDGSGRQSDFPICVEAQLTLGGKTQIGIMIVLGTYKKGMIGEGEIWMIYLNGDENLNVLNSLSEVESYANR